MKNESRLSVMELALVVGVLLMCSMREVYATDRTEQLIQLIAAKVPPTGVSDGEWYENKDRMIRQLSQRNPPVPNLAQRLATIVRDEETDAVTRDYILQHMQLSLVNRATQSEREFIRNELRATVAEAKDAQSGTALLALVRMSRTDKEVTKDYLAVQALELLEDSSADKASASVAIGVLASVDPERARKYLQKKLVDDEVMDADQALKAVAEDLGLIIRSDCSTCGLGGGK